MAYIKFNSVQNLPADILQTYPLSKTQTESFGNILSDEIAKAEPLRFSKHALSRLESRGITLGQEEMKKLGQAVNEAQGKGIQDSLVLLNKLAFIVSVPDRTVVTAMPADESSVFTNIDGAVIA